MATDIQAGSQVSHPSGTERTPRAYEPAQDEALEVTQEVVPSGLPLMPRGMALRVAALARRLMRTTR
jgi:hypothetical protein